MKNLSIVLNIILLLAVAVLYVLYFSGNKPSASTASGDTTTINSKIAYINSDTVLKYYDYLKVNKEQLEAKTKQMDQDYQNRANGLRNEIASYQRNVNSMTLGQVKATEEDLAKKQQNLQLYQQSLSQQLMEEESKLNRALYERITAFLKTYGEQKGLQVVLKFDPTSDVLYGSRALDITRDVIEGLNASYQQEKNAPQKDTSKK